MFKEIITFNLGISKLSKKKILFDKLFHSIQSSNLSCLIKFNLGISKLSKR